MTPLSGTACQVAQASIRGNRPMNEDCVYVSADRGWYLVADAAGGPGKGDLACQVLLECLEAASDLEQGVQDANARIHDLLRADPSRKGMGATVAFARLTGDRIDIHWAGEVRVYLIREGVPRLLTEDHTLANQLVKLKQIQPEDVVGHPGRKTPLRYLGKEETIRLDHGQLSILPGDVIVICTDGFYLGVGEAELVGLARAGQDLEQHLAAAMALADGKDNASAVAVRVPTSAGVGGLRANLAISTRLRMLLDDLLDSAQPELTFRALVQDLLALIQVEVGAAGAVLLHQEGTGVRLLGQAGQGTTDPSEVLHDSERWLAMPVGRTGKLVLALRWPPHLGPGDRPEPGELSAWLELVSWLEPLERVLALRLNGARQAENGKVVHEIGRAASASLDLDEVLRVLLAETLALTRGDVAYVIFPEDGELRFGAGLDQRGERVAGLQVSQTLIRRVLATGDPVCILDTGADEDAQTESVMALDVQSVMCVPMVARDELVGLLYVSSRLANRTFGVDDLGLLVAIAAQTALAVQNARYVSQLEEKQKIEHELAIARTIQMGLLPQDLPTVPGYSLASRCVPAKEVGGDLFDVLSDGRRRFGLFVGDVSGKSISAALYMAVVRTALRSLQDLDVPPDETLRRVNAQVARDFTRGSFVTAFLAILDSDTGRLRYASAGHQVGLLRRRNGSLTPLTTPGMPLGMDTAMFGVHIGVGEAMIDSGETLVLYTDGITEAMDLEGREFGEEGLSATVAGCDHQDAQEVADAVLAQVSAFVGEAEPHDDMTLLVIRRYDQ